MTKYGAKKVIIDDIQFDSKAEGEYYKILRQQLLNNEIKDFSLQPEFELQPPFEMDGKKIRAIKYIADFKVIQHDGTEQIIDIKGMETTDFKLKKKMFEYKFRIPLVCLTKVNKFGGWITTDEYKKRKREERK